MRCVPVILVAVILVETLVIVVDVVTPQEVALEIAAVIVIEIMVAVAAGVVAMIDMRTDMYVFSVRSLATICVLTMWLNVNVIGEKSTFSCSSPISKSWWRDTSTQKRVTLSQPFPS
jgi:Na+-translocating ferredoxin:NAD+ oxidoreductase RnfE subunit